MTTNKIEIKDLTVNYIENKKTFNALHNVSFGVGKGEFVSVIGASGCGKSTLLSRPARCLPRRGHRRLLGGRGGGSGWTTHDGHPHFGGHHCRY